MEPQTSNIFIDVTAQRSIDKIDLLFMIDNSASMRDKQEMLKLAVPQLLGRLLNPWCRDANGSTAPPSNGTCPAGFFPEFEPIDDIHIGVISSSLGSPGAQACADGAHDDDAAHFIGLTRTQANGSALSTYQGLGFLAWDPKGKKANQGLPPGESDPNRLVADFQALVEATGETGCGYEASLESWYRFLVDPEPPAQWVIEGDVARPVGVDQELLEQRRQFLRPDSLVAVIMLSDENDCSLDFSGDGWLLGYAGDSNGAWYMPRGTSDCATDPNGACCRPCVDEPNGPPTGCVAVANDPVCVEAKRHNKDTDPPNLRCFDQKRRFGVERLYPVRRYIDALRSPTIVGRDGTQQQNPLFTDLNTGLAASRTPDLVFLAGIVGVPWQDIATSDSLGPGAEQTLRYQDSESLTQNDVWSQILGAPDAAPTNPLMLQSVQPRQGTTPSGIALASPESNPMQNPINGHEYYPSSNADLQYSCIFPLPSPVTCQDQYCDCAHSDETRTPLCQADDGQYTQTQRYGKAYPGLRQLAVLKGVEQSGIVASICPKLLPPASSAGAPDPNVGYNPAVGAILQSIGSKLGGKCVPRKLAPDQETGRVPCAMVEVLNRDEQGQCAPCSSIPGRTDPSSNVAAVVTKQLVSSGRCTKDSCPVCQCEIQQAEGPELEACQNDPNASAPGYCYIDRAAKVGDPSLIHECPDERGLRFVGEETPRNGAQTFIACVGEPFRDEPNQTGP